MKATRDRHFQHKGLLTPHIHCTGWLMAECRESISSQYDHTPFMKWTGSLSELTHNSGAAVHNEVQHTEQQIQQRLSDTLTRTRTYAHAHTHARTPSMFCTVKMWHGTCTSCSMVLLLMPEQRLHLHLTSSFATLFRLCQHESAANKCGQITRAQPEHSVTPGRQRCDNHCSQIPSYLNCKRLKEPYYFNELKFYKCAALVESQRYGGHSHLRGFSPFRSELLVLFLLSVVDPIMSSRAIQLYAPGMASGFVFVRLEFLYSLNLCTAFFFSFFFNVLVFHTTDQCNQRAAPLFFWAELPAFGGEFLNKLRHSGVAGCTTGLYFQCWKWHACPALGEPTYFYRLPADVQTGSSLQQMLWFLLRNHHIEEGKAG